MYIPDAIRIVARGQRAQVFSDDAGHENDEAFPAANVSVNYNEFTGLRVSVEFGTRIERIGSPVPKMIMMDYPSNRVKFDLQYPD